MVQQLDESQGQGTRATFPQSLLWSEERSFPPTTALRKSTRKSSTSERGERQSTQPLRWKKTVDWTTQEDSVSSTNLLHHRSLLFLPRLARSLHWATLLFSWRLSMENHAGCIWPRAEPRLIVSSSDRLSLGAIPWALDKSNGSDEQGARRCALGLPHLRDAVGVGANARHVLAQQAQRLPPYLLALDLHDLFQG